MKICPNCGSEVLENAQYCTRCGWHFKAVDDHKTADQKNQPASITSENSELPATESISEPRTIAAERPQAAAGQHEPRTSTDPVHAQKAAEPSYQNAMAPSREEASDVQNVTEQPHPLVNDPKAASRPNWIQKQQSARLVKPKEIMSPRHLRVVRKPESNPSQVWLETHLN